MNCLITISDYHDTDGEIEKSELTTTADISGIAQDYTIVYDEQSDELKGCTTTLRITDGNSIIISREGKYNTELRIEQGKRNLCYYSTPVGQIVMGVYTSKVHSEFEEGKIVELEFSYSLDFNNNLVSENRLKITAEYKEVR